MNERHNKAIEKLNKQFEQLKKYRQSYESVWQDIVDNFAPYLGGYINPKGLLNAGDREDTVIYDSTPVMAVQECAAAVYSFTTPRSRRWFGLGMDERTMQEGTQAREWLDYITELHYKIMGSSNFYDAKQLMKLHRVTVGTAVSLTYPDYDNVVRYEVLNIGEYWLGIDAKNEHDTLFRVFTRSAKQLIEEFGDKVPEKIRNQAKINQQTEESYDVVHVICKNNDNLGNFPKPWLSAYYLQSAHEGEFLKISGFKFKPFVVSTGFRNRGEIYGKASPAWNTLPDAKQLQQMALDWFEAVAKVNRPPMQGKAEILENDMLDLTPGAYNQLSSVANADNFLKPLYAINPELKSLFESIRIKQEEVRKGMYIDKFQIVTMRIDKTMTATEINRLAGEALQAVTPLSESVNKELNEDFEVIYAYADQAGIIPEPPPELEWQSFVPQYLSALSQSQKQADVNVIAEVAETAINWSNMANDPSIRDSVNFDFALNAISKAKSAPAGLMFAPEVVEQLRQARAQQQQMMQAGMAAEQMANTAKTAGETPVGGDNVLGKVMEMVGGQK